VWSAELTFVVNESCIRCKTMDCVAVCPVDCFYEGENMLVIHPDECIDCGVCEPECPVDAIKADTEPELAVDVDLGHSPVSITRTRIWRKILEFIRLPLPLLPVARGRFFYRNIWPDFRVFRIQ